MRKADAEQVGRHGSRREPFGQVAVRVALSQRRGQQHKPEGFENQRLRGEAQMRVRRHRFQAHGTGPDRLGESGIVIAGDQHPRALEGSQAVEEAVNGLVVHALGIEHVAGHEDSVNALRGGQACQALDYGEPRVGEQGRVIGLKLTELLADLPVGGVQELDQRGTPSWRETSL